MSNDYSRSMSRRSDADLVRITGQDRDQYAPEAIQAAGAMGSGNLKTDFEGKLKRS